VRNFSLIKHCRDIKGFMNSDILQLCFVNLWSHFELSTFGTEITHFSTFFFSKD
jgi:hypothetical protein